MKLSKQTKVLFLTLYTRQGASTRIRVLQFIPLLEQQGIKCTVKPLINLGRNQFLQNIIALPKRFFQILSAWKYDAVFIQKDILIIGIDRLLTFLNRNIIYEFDDAIFVNGLNNGSLKSKFIDYRIKRFNKMLKISRHVIVENSYLADYVKQHFPDKPVAIINAPIDTERYTPKQKNKENKEVIIGWVGSPTTAPMLRIIEKPIMNICKKYKNVKIVLIGAPDFKVGFPAVKLAWDEEIEVKEIQKFDIGLMPLDEKPFNKNRFGYKLAQYMAVGIPYVRSDIGVHKNIDEEIDKYCLALTDDEWEEKLSALIENEKLRERLGKRARKLAEERFDLKKYSKEMIEILENVTNKYY